jgi:hypothetical protein
MSEVVLNVKGEDPLIYVKYTGFFRNFNQSYDGVIYCFNKRKRINLIPQSLFAKLAKNTKIWILSSEKEFMDQFPKKTDEQFFTPVAKPEIKKRRGRPKIKK